jgi:polyketide cyclase/dehydrase/lipid transport protein
MAGPCRSHALIEAPVDEVWATVCDPRTHPGWWPDLPGVEVDGELEEGGQYVRKASGRLNDRADSVWVAERLEHLKEAHFRCTLSGMYARFALTPAQDGTFVEAETGMLPTSVRWRMVSAVSGSYMRRWVQDALDALPDAVEHGQGE